jgi:uncharacterized protein YkwD
MTGRDRLNGQSDPDALYGGSGLDKLWGKGDYRDGRTDGPLVQLAAGQSEKLQPPPVVSNPSVSDLEAAIVAYTNQERQARGLSPLAVNVQLLGAARHHAGNMARFNLMAHTLSQADLPDLGSRLNYYDYRYMIAGENVAWNYSGAQAVVAAWMNSPGHRANILNPDFTEIGVGISYNGAGQLYYCQVFGKAF